ncbi:hypothetical protein ONE63_000992 [Megalurothrips usitatus]|uniref:LRRCT domain-containing protein n=1 Tax=Megalurothrips usitatus TaxID=439358 RepID=A0AAV7Y1A2_9NEOP|nr:hypothetical protein ONE63_000992 [Megalurothrips usitatus]
MISHSLLFVLQTLLILSPSCSSDVSAAQSRPQICDRCLCGKTEKSPYLVNCTNTGFTNTSVLQYLPSNTETLIFNGNNVSILPWNVFGNQNTPHLKVVDMSNNVIREIRGKAYHHVASVETLILDHNELSLSSAKSGVEDHRHPRMFSNFINLKALHLTNAFRDNSPSNLAHDLHDIFIYSNLSALIKLHLEQNELTGFVDQTVFCDLPALMDLHLGDNHLRGLHFNITCLHHLRFLDLRRNRITRLSKSDLGMLDLLPARGQPLMIDLNGNPLCDCADLHDWLKTTKVTVRNKESLNCNSSSAVKENSKEDAMQHVSCTMHTSILPVGAKSPSPPQSVGRGTALTAVLLTIAGIGLIVALIYLKRMHFQPRCSSLLDTVSRKVQYTTIGHHEDEVVDV